MFYRDYVVNACKIMLNIFPFLKEVQEYTYCKEHIHTALQGIYRFPDRGLEKRQGLPPLHTGFCYCT